MCSAHLTAYTMFVPKLNVKLKINFPIFIGLQLISDVWELSLCTFRQDDKKHSSEMTLHTKIELHRQDFDWCINDVGSHFILISQIEWNLKCVLTLLTKVRLAQKCRWFQMEIKACSQFELVVLIKKYEKCHTYKIYHIIFLWLVEISSKIRPPKNLIKHQQR